MTAISKRIEKLNKKIEEMESAIIKESPGLSFWMCKRIMSLERWQSIANKGRYEEAIKYIPNGFIKNPIDELAPKNASIDGFVVERFKKWMDDYDDYLHYSKNPELGATYCRKCLLEDDKDQEMGSGLSLRNIVRQLTQLSFKDTGKSTTLSSPSSTYASGATSHDHNNIQNRLEKTRIISTANKQEEKKSRTAFERQQQPPPPPSSSLVTIDYPCTVHNRFKCPYQSSSSEINDGDLVGTGIGLHVIYHALLYAHMLTYQTRDYTYKVDFETDRKIETISKYGGWFSNSYNKRFGVELANLKQPKVPIESIRDIYKSLTDIEILNVLLKDYFEHRRNNPNEYREDIPTSDYSKRKEQHDALIQLIIECFMEVKDDIRIEDLTNFNGISMLQEEQEEKAKRSHLDQNTIATFVDHFNDICCECDTRWACILCVNCNEWVCADHQNKHKATHRLKQEEQCRDEGFVD